MPKANEYQVGGFHYKTKIEHWDYVLANQVPYLEAMVIKYLTRWRAKGGHQDIRKAYHFIVKLAETEGVDLQTEKFEQETGEAGPGYVCQDPDGGKISGPEVGKSQSQIRPETGHTAASFDRTKLDIQEW